MKEFVIRVENKDVYINNKLYQFDYQLDSDPEDDLNEKVILALAISMGYRDHYLFEELSKKLFAHEIGGYYGT
jgi:hypothetical protein